MQIDEDNRVRVHIDAKKVILVVVVGVNAKRARNSSSCEAKKQDFENSS